MKKIIITVCLIHAFGLVRAQQDSVTNPGMIMASKIAQRLKDSLLLTDTQAGNVYAINVQLHRQKLAVRRKYTSMDSLTYYIQRIEYTRDSLYYQVLPNDKYLLYRQKKTNLVKYQ